MREHLLLKGGTAINLTVFDLPRLSVDVDMDYTPNDIKEDMLEARGKITTLIKSYMDAEGYQLSDSSRFTHSLDAFYATISAETVNEKSNPPAMLGRIV